MHLLSSLSARECTKKMGWFVLLWYIGEYRLDVKYYCFHIIVFLLLNHYKKVCLNVPEILITWNSVRKR